METDKLPENNTTENNIPPDVPQFRGILVVLAENVTRILKNQKLLLATRATGIIIASLAAIITVMVFFLYLVPLIVETVPVKGTTISNDADLKKDPLYKKEISLMNRELQRLSRRYASYTSGQSYVVINTTDNKFMLYRNRQLVREGFCSSGSYTLLQTAGGDKKWIFKTPKGKYWIQGKTADPVWRKPDWAFVEEGLPVPSADHPSRYEYGVLGDYALAIGDGYLIHGTIYKRFLGMPVTHGCVRLNDEDLEAIYNTLNIGSRVYIF